MANSIKDFTADKLAKMGASGRKGSAGDGEFDAARKSDDFGMTAAGESNSSIKFKRGGAVHGEAAKARMDRPARKSGGMCETGQGERVARASGGRVKGKTTVNIIIGGDKGQQQGAQAVPVPVPVPAGGAGPQMPPPKPPMAVMPMGAAPGGMGGAPMGGPGMPPPMPGRAAGGRVNANSGAAFKERFGSRSGEGRLAKIRGGAKADGMMP